MLIALIADVHGNALALEACLAQARKLGAERFVFLGDLVGYGAEPNEVVQMVRGMPGAAALLGNHDQAVSVMGQRMNPAALAAIEWTRRQLSGDAKAWLASLPVSLREDDRLYVHASAARPLSWPYVLGGEEARASFAATDAAITFVGHVHVPALYCMSETAKLIVHRPLANVALPLGLQRRWLAVIGSCGQPRDNNPSAGFATYDTATRELCFRRAPYDAEAACARIRAAGLPDMLAVRLLVGR
jgi:diadenosine tetraphosphatase ApaH/serine/threonine PP2A family protein phosphatase